GVLVGSVSETRARLEPGYSMISHTFANSANVWGTRLLVRFGLWRGTSSEELLLHRWGHSFGRSAKTRKFIGAVQCTAISLWAARETRAHQKQRNIFLCLHRI